MNNHFFLIIFGTTIIHAVSSAACGFESEYSHASSYESPFVYNLAAEARKAAEQFVAKNSQFTVYTLPWQFSSEYAQHLDEVISKLNKSSNNGFFHITRYDLNKAIKRYFSDFCKTLQELILKEQLSTVISQKVQTKLRSHGFSSEYSLPSRFVADFRDKVSMIKARAESHISSNAKTYIREHELENIVHDELHAFLVQVKNSSSSYTSSYDNNQSYASYSTSNYPQQSSSSITNAPSFLPSDATLPVAALAQESCAICLDGYKIGDKTGLLSCNHMYHKDCIYTWLKTSKTCPLCRAQNVIVSQQKTVC